MRTSRASVTFMLNREDGMGISDTFPLKLGLSKTHHNLSHATDKEGQLQFAKYDLFLSQQIAHFLERLNEYQDRNGSVLDNTIVLFGSGASTTHNSAQPADADRRRSQHGPEARHLLAKTARRGCRTCYLSILRSLGIEQESFSDSTGTLSESDLQPRVEPSRQYACKFMPSWHRKRQISRFSSSELRVHFDVCGHSAAGRRLRVPR